MSHANRFSNFFIGPAREPQLEVHLVQSVGFVRFWQVCRFLTNCANCLLGNSARLCDFILGIAREPQLFDALVPRGMVSSMPAPRQDAATGSQARFLLRWWASRPIVQSCGLIPAQKQKFQLRVCPPLLAGGVFCATYQRLAAAGLSWKDRTMKKTVKTTQLTARLSCTLSGQTVNRLKAVAKASGMPVSAVFREILATHLPALERELAEKRAWRINPATAKYVAQQVAETGKSPKAIIEDCCRVAMRQQGHALR